MVAKNRINLTNGKSDPIPAAPVADVVHTVANQPTDSASFRNMVDEGTEKPKMYETENDLSLKQRKEVNTLLNQRLADAVDLQMQTREEALKIAHELALLNSHLAHDAPAAIVTPDRRSLTSQSDVDPKTELLEAVPESERWDPVPGSTGHKVSTASRYEEDDGGRSANERLVAAGVAEAENDQIRQARSETARNT